jgi:hypothetical protein
MKENMRTTTMIPKNAAPPKELTTMIETVRKTANTIPKIIKTGYGGFFWIRNGEVGG